MARCLRPTAVAELRSRLALTQLKFITFGASATRRENPEKANSEFVHPTRAPRTVTCSGRA